VWLIRFGATVGRPIPPGYIITALDSPIVYFAIAEFLAALVGVVVQRRWGKLRDKRGAAGIVLLRVLVASIIPAPWDVIPRYWLEFAVEICANLSWPGHFLGITLRSVELAGQEVDRSAFLAWTNLAQCAGAFVSTLWASWFVVHPGVITPLFDSAGLRPAGIVVTTRPAGPAQVATQP